MIRINLSRYGFVRCPERDFVDDSHKFQVFCAGDLFVTKLVYNGAAYISGEAVINDKLTYAEYSELPHYRALHKLNGVPVLELTEEDLKQFYYDCLSYVSEWKACEAAIEYPDYETIWCLVKRQHYVANCRTAELRRLCTLEALAEMDDYQLKAFREAAMVVLAEARFDVDDRARSLVGTRNSRELIKQTDEELIKPSFWYERCMKLLKKP